MKKLLLLIFLLSVQVIVNIPTSTSAEPQTIDTPTLVEAQTIESVEISSLIRTKGHPGIVPSPEVIQMYRDQGSTPPRVVDWQAPLLASPVTGTRKILVIRVDFSDRVGIQSQTYFNNLVFGTSQGQLKHYYAEVSYNQLTITGTVTATWFRSSHTMVYWGSDGGYTDDLNGPIFELAREAVVLANSAINFKSYDTDNDNVLDPEELSLCIVHAGNAQESTGVFTDIWSHRWYIYGQGYTYDGTPLTDTIVDGVRVSKHPGDYVGGYFMEAETSKMGTFAHEFGHDLGLPDLYDLDYTSEGIGDWDLMASGSWLGPSRDGTRPAHPCAWCKYKLGWITPTAITAATIGATLNRIETSATQSLYKLPIATGSDVEYFLIENRQKTGYDQYLPGSGVLIWHIDERQWGNQNVDENHKLVDLEEADGWHDLDLWVNPGDATDPWYSNPAGFTGISTPNSNSYSGALTGIKVKNISPSSATMTVDFEATQGWTQIAYDDGEPEGYSYWTGAGGMFAVRFTPSTSGQLKTASFFFLMPGSFKVHVLDASRNDLISPLTRTPTFGGWYDVDLTAQSITISTGVDFYIGMESRVANMPWLVADTSSPDGRSWEWNLVSWTRRTTRDYAIRAEVQPITPGTVPLSSVGNSIINAVAGSVYFIYPDYDPGHSKGNGAIAAALSDFTAMGAINGMTANTQLACLDTSSSYVTQSNGKPSMTGKGIVLVGGPIVHACVKYYEGQRIAPVYFGMEGSKCYWYTKAGVKLSQTAMDTSVFNVGLAYHQDMFVVETFLDSNGNTVFIIYGYGWKGSFAGGTFFKSVIYPNISSYTHAYYIYKWNDTNNDGFPDLNEISQVTYGD